MTRTLVAGFGNVLRGDDGFGVEVIRRLHESTGAGRPDDGSDTVELLDVGTGGLRLAQELLDGYDRVIVVDAMTRGGEPGTVYLLAVEEVGAVGSVDMHLALPSRALAVARALGALPGDVWLVGCEPAVVDDLAIGLSAAVEPAVERAVLEIRRLVASGAGARADAARNAVRDGSDGNPAVAR